MLRRGFWVALAVLVLLALTTSVVWAAPLAQDEGEVATDVLWTTLAPIVAIATFVERVLESFWERYEKKGAWPNKDGVPDSSAAEHVEKKKMGSSWLGTGIALVAVGLTNVRFFHLLGLDVLFSSPKLVLFDLGIGGIFDDFTVGTLVDWLATAAVVGWGGTELTHSVIEGLVKGRSLWKEMREVQAGSQSITEAKFFNEYVAPILEDKGISVATLRQTFATLKGVGVSADTVISQMTIGKVDEYLDALAADPGKTEASRAVRTLLDGVPPEKAIEIPNVLNLLSPEQRKRFLGA